MRKLKNGTQFRQIAPALLGWTDQVNSLRACPERGKLRVIQKNLRRIGKQRTIPQPVDPAIEDRLLHPGIEIDRGSQRILAIGNDDFSRLILAQNRRGQRLRTKQRVKHGQRDMNALEE